jgi:Flp pilus assembly protein TadB
VRPEEISTVCRAVRGGPVPADPEIRAAAWRLASHDSAEAKLRLFVAIPATVLVIAGTIAQADYSLLYLGLAVLCVLTLGWLLYWTRHLKQRVALLAES